ncbi:cupin domain-containing protein [Streptomyces sp. NPDC056161]|uniref:cupin domain-containing protein n=1 Tax=Streptomyces sp. NPDC056161 TaxID=3345732 RepID=UPI0035E1F5E8
MFRMPAPAALLISGVVLATVACAPAADRTDADRTGADEPAPRASAAAPAAAATAYPSETLTKLLEQPLPNVKGKTFTSTVVDFPPNARAVPHRHGQAFVYAYVLDGTIRSQLAGQPARTYHQGQNWVEKPGAHHLSTVNTSRTEPARLLVVFISDTGAPIKVDDPAK